MKIGLVVPTYDRYGDPAVIADVIAAAEDLGYDSVYFGDHIVVPAYARNYTNPHWYDALTCAIAGIGMTKRLRFGMDVLVAPYRDPILLAKMAATATELSGGRLMLGFGVGFLKGEFEALGIPPYSRRGDVTDEYLRVMRLLLESNSEVPLAFEGEWVRFEDVHFGPSPATPPPLLVGGNHRRAIERAALLGDGWHPLWPTPQEYAEGRRRILSLREGAGLARPFTFSFSCPYTRIESRSPDVGSTGFHEGGGPPDDYNYSPPVPTAPDGRPRFVGTQTQLMDDLREYAAAGVEQLCMRFAFPWDEEVPPARFLEEMRQFADDILPDCETL